MPGVVVDHLVAVLVLGGLFVAAVVIVPSVVYVGLLGVDEQQLRNVAGGVFKSILLDEGYPVGWGSSSYFNGSSVKRFGLALPGAGPLYVLDSDKVERLVVGNPLGYLEYARAKELLRLQQYGFGVKITAPFRVLVSTLSTGSLYTLKYEVVVTLNNGKPVPNALVKGVIVYSKYEGGSGEDERYSIHALVVKGTTNELGKAVIECKVGTTYSDIVAIFKATVSNVATFVFYRSSTWPSDIAILNIVGDEVILTHPKSDPNDNRWIENAALLTDEELVGIFNGTKYDALNYGSKVLWSKSFPGLKSQDPVLLIFNINAVEKNSGRKGILVVGPYPNTLGDRVIWYGGVPQGTIVELQAPVVISGMTYIVTFTFWREA